MKISTEGMVIGVNGNWNAMPNLSKRSMKGDNVTFTSDIDNNKKSDSITYTKLKSSSGANYEVTANINGKSYKVGKEYFESASEIKGFFIDIDGDGRMEWVTFGTATVLGSKSSSKVLKLDFSEP